MLQISGKDNVLFKKVKKLKQKKYREIEQLFLAEGVKFLDFSTTPNYIFIDEEFDLSLIEQELEKFQCEKYILSSGLFSQLSSQENSQGVILVYSYEKYSLDNLENNIVVLDKVSDPGNLGTIIRTVDAAGFKDIILTTGSVDCYNEKVIRSTMGSIFNARLRYMNEDEMVMFLKDKDYRLISTALDKNSVPYTEIKLKKKNAIIFGNEGNGISKSILAVSDEKVIIPIYGSAESLNVGVACGIILYKIREII
ncbi:RNA methyltransferase [Fusobacterium sp. FSA-380-WT-3A]|uniref:TrmH family RNA methyltransferase n=1 Tax=Fusobacterium sp. FSA-380-WT-3A TaxID=2725304 RepID=UPI001476C448|nr:RNA methyltransferase [Fusobacterium sp. FSA-380-WT-3A]NME35201.1 RNA methyltransferase [Fusobacterium sp. FSA-380-WT-3A]